jgi:hypothetical protein
MRPFKAIILILVGIVVLPVAAVAAFVGFDALAVHMFYRSRPILNAMHTAPSVKSWVDDSGPAKLVFLRHLPLGSSKERFIAALSRESFTCRDKNSGESAPSIECAIDAKSNFGMRTYWFVHGNFDDRGHLVHVRIALRTIWL